MTIHKKAMSSAIKSETDICMTPDHRAHIHTDSWRTHSQGTKGTGSGKGITKGVGYTIISGVLPARLTLD